jgi:hypothetical protein
MTSNAIAKMIEFGDRKIVPLRSPKPQQTDESSPGLHQILGAAPSRR